jgi:tRNA-dihydrouridine synthase
MYTGQANWDAIARAAAVVHEQQTVECPTTILGNGDIKSLAQIPNLVEKYKVDGVLVGRATLGNPWFFEGLDLVKAVRDVVEQADQSKFKDFEEIKFKLLQHLRIYDKLFGEVGFVSQRKHMGWYIKGFPNAAALRAELMKTENLADVEKILAKKP